MLVDVVRYRECIKYAKQSKLEVYNSQNSLFMDLRVV